MRLVALAILGAVLLPGCASLTNNTAQPLVVQTTCGDVPVQGATCRLMNAKGSWTVQSTPGAVMVRKAPSDMAVDCRMPNVTPVPTLYESHATLGAWGNVLVGGLVGFGYDAYNDAAWGYHTDVTVDMCKGQPPGVVKAVQDRQAAVNEGRTPAAAMSMTASSTTSYVTGERKWAFEAEKLAKARSCSAAPTAVLSARGPATEVYTIGCSNGDALMAKCTWGECKAI